MCQESTASPPVRPFSHVTFDTNFFFHLSLSLSLSPVGPHDTAYNRQPAFFPTLNTVRTRQDTGNQWKVGGPG